MAVPTSRHSPLVRCCVTAAVAHTHYAGSCGLAAGTARGTVGGRDMWGGRGVKEAGGGINMKRPRVFLFEFIGPSAAPFPFSPVVMSQTFGCAGAKHPCGTNAKGVAYVDISEDKTHLNYRRQLDCGGCLS